MKRKLSPLPYEAGECSSSSSRRPGFTLDLFETEDVVTKKACSFLSLGGWSLPSSLFVFSCMDTAVSVVVSMMRCVQIFL